MIETELHDGPIRVHLQLRIEPAEGEPRVIVLEVPAALIVGITPGKPFTSLVGNLGSERIATLTMGSLIALWMAVDAANDHQAFLEGVRRAASSQMTMCPAVLAAIASALAGIANQELTVIGGEADDD